MKTMTAAEFKKLGAKADKRDVPAELIAQLRAAGIPMPEREHKFWPGRKFAFDLCWLLHNIAVECDGGTWSNGRHTRGRGFENDCVKLNEAVIRGFRVLRFTTEMVEDGRALAAIERAFGRDRTGGW